MAKDISKLIFDIVDEDALMNIVDLSENKVVGKKIFHNFDNLINFT